MSNGLKSECEKAFISGIVNEQHLLFRFLGWKVFREHA